MSEPDGQSNQSPRRMTPLDRARWLIVAALAGLLVTASGLVVVVAINNRGRLPVLSPEDFEKAQSRWAAKPLSNYDAEVRVVARSHEVYKVQVRDGVVLTAERDGVPIRQARSQETWSIPGMFDTISSDIDNLRIVESGKADANTPQLALRGLFDAEHGHPIRYLRTEKKKWSPNYEVSWEVTIHVIGDAE